MKIVHIILTSQNGGAEQVFVDYSRILKDNLGHKVLAIVKHDAPYVSNLEQFNISVKKIKNNFGYYDIFAINDIKKIIEEFNADAVVAHAGKSIILARKAIKKIKHKKIFQVAINHSMNVKRSIGADVIISINRAMFFKTIDLGQSKEKSFVVHNAIDLSDIDDVVEKLPDTVNWSSKKTITLGVMGRLDKAKSFDLAIKALKLLENNHPDKKFILKIAGGGLEESYLRQLVKELNLDDKVEFMGWVKNKKDFFDAIDIFLMTSQRETFGLVVLEAMKFGKVIISGDTDGSKEMIRNEINGLMIDLNPINNAEYRFVEAINKIINDSDLTNKMIENAFQTLKEKFSFQALTERLRLIFGSQL